MTHSSAAATDRQPRAPLRIAVTMGDPHGIGPELAVQCALHRFPDGTPWQPVIYGPSAAWEALPSHLLGNLRWQHAQPGADDGGATILRETDETQTPIRFGEPDASAGAHAFRALKAACDDLAGGAVDGLLTLPINKAVIAQAGFRFPGHTEFLADRFGGEPLMTFVHQNFRLALTTIHLPLRQVPDAITRPTVAGKMNALAQTLRRDFDIAAPRVAVLGLNPHAGESGNIGHEEVEVIEPAVAAARAGGLDVEGPFPADAFFAFGHQKRFDGILGMYHDQGLVAFKGLTGGAGVNYTAGLPIVRTSPDHGTAYDIAGKGIAEPASSLEALEVLKQVVIARAGKA